MAAFSTWLSLNYEPERIDATLKILIAGGTSFVGRAIAWSAWHHGHELTVFNRGVTPSDLPETIERLYGDRNGDLSALAGRHFDATIDTIAYRPLDVRMLAHALDGRGGQYLQISSVSAYESPSFANACESELQLKSIEGLDPDVRVSGATYGLLKAASEFEASRSFAESVTIVRPTYVIGAHDATLRFPYWVERIRRGGEVAVPGPGSALIQYVDARDLANFCVRLIEEKIRGSFHVAGPQGGEEFMTVVENIATLVAPTGTTLREIDPREIVATNLGSKFPLWGGGASDAVLSLNSGLALAHGLDLRPLSDSVEDVTSWWGERAWPDNWLSARDEARLLAN
ncbi:MAG: NAD-dependent epimerase/dehydratase family protein [Acidimicrobiales bacterium]